MVEYHPREFDTVQELLDALQNDPTLTYVAIPSNWVDGKVIKKTLKSMLSRGKTRKKDMWLEISGNQYLVVSDTSSVSNYIFKVK